MFSQYFGQYLLNKGIVTPEQLRNCLELLDSVHVKLGVLAMNSGMLSSGQVEEIQQAQSRVDKKFGELSVEMGYLTELQVEELLNTQKKGHLLLGQALLDQGYLTLAQLEASLNQYVEEYNLSETELSALEEGDVEAIVDAFVDFSNAASKQVYSDYLALMLRSIIRFIDETPRLETSWLLKEYSAPWLAYQEISGSINLFTGIAGDREVLLEMAGKFAGKNFTEMDELAKASTSEFLNLHNGIFLVNMSNNGIELEMKPQVVQKDPKLMGLGKGFVIPIYLSSGKFDLIISDFIPTFLS